MEYRSVRKPLGPPRRREVDHVREHGNEERADVIAFLRARSARHRVGVRRVVITKAFAARHAAPHLTDDLTAARRRLDDSTAGAGRTLSVLRAADHRRHGELLKEKRQDDQQTKGHAVLMDAGDLSVQ
jgi:hypothetical protein